MEHKENEGEKLLQNDHHMIADEEEETDDDVVKATEAIHQEEEEIKKPKCIKLFSDKDEITLLQGFARFRSEIGNKDTNDWVKFHNFIKDQLSNVLFTKTQVFEKMRRLRTKLERNLLKEKRKGAPQFSNLHESQVFVLSKAIWAEEMMKGKIVELDVGEKIFASRKQEYETKYPHLCASFKEYRFPLHVRENWYSLIGREQAQEFEDEWKKLAATDTELEIRKSQFALKYKMNALAATQKGSG